MTLVPEDNTIDGEEKRVVKLRWKKIGDTSGVKVLKDASKP